ncbi:transcriptional regulator Spx [Schinkia sp. CFF1]
MTATIYGSPSESFRKTKDWFVKHKIPYKERNIFKNPLTVHELQEVLALTAEGTDEIVAKRSNIYKELNLDFDNLSLLELLSFIEKHPGLLRNPIIIDNKKMVIGYNEDDIRKFLPRKVRKRQWLQFHMERLSMVDGLR